MANIREGNPKVRQLAKDHMEKARRGRTPLSDDEKTPDMRFKRVAGKRVTRILNLLKGLRQCANTDVYEYTEEQVDSMFKAITASLNRTIKVYQEPQVNGKVPAKVESFFG